MEIDLNQVITGAKKEAFKDADGKDLILKNAILLSLLSYKDQNQSVEDCLKIQKIFDKVDEADGKIDLKSDDVVKLKSVLARGALSPLMAGKVIALLEPEVQ